MPTISPLFLRPPSARGNSVAVFHRVDLVVSDLCRAAVLPAFPVPADLLALGENRSRAARAAGDQVDCFSMVQAELVGG